MKKGKNDRIKTKEENYIYISEDILIMLINYLFNTTKISAEHYNNQFKYYKFLSLELELKLEIHLKYLKRKLKV